MKARVKIPETTATIPVSESMGKMLAYAAWLKNMPVPERKEQSLSSFDHDGVGRSSSIANSSDRMRMCDPGKPCAMCRQRAALGLAYQIP